ncbi:MAG: SRPBCC domain-containing protein [Flavobacteriales bacterium]|jgi:hypothetical protein|nr:SRPBCC domain-containing protein [Flavobacteriales bacterium]
MQFTKIHLGILFVFGLFVSSCSEDKICSPDQSLTVVNSNITTNADSSTFYIYTDIVINAPKEEVWNVLTNWEKMGDWSTSFIGLTGDIRDEGQIVAHYLLGTDTLHFPHALHFVDGEEFGWADPIAFAPQITDNHLFKLEAISDCQTRFIQTDEFTGENPQFPLPALSAQTQEGYNLFNSQLKKEVED